MIGILPMCARLFAILAMLLVAAFSLAGQPAAMPAVILNAEQTWLPLNDRMAMLLDPSDTMTVSEVAAAASDRFRSPGSPSNGWISPAAQWRVVTLVNPAGRAQQRIIEVQRPYLDEVDLYISGGAEILHYQGGAARPFSIRPLPSRASVFPVRVPAGQSRTLFLRVQSTSPLDIYVSQWTQAEYTSHNHLEIILQSAMHGMAIVMLVLTGLAWWFGRWRTALWLLLHMSFYELRVMVEDGMLGSIVLPEHPMLTKAMFGFSGGMVMATAVLLVYNILNFRQQFPKTARIYLLLAPLSAVLVLPALAGRYDLTVLPLQVVLAVLIPASLVLMALCYRRGDRAALPLMLGMLLAFVSGSIRTGLHFGLPIPAGAIEWSFQPGFICYAVVMVFAAVSRYQGMESEKAGLARRLLAATEQREQALAADVQRRTSELQRLNRALAAYSRSLSAAIRAETFDEQAARMCASIVEDPIYVLSILGLPESAAGLPVRIVAGAGSAIRYMDGLKLSWSADVPEGQGPTGIALRQGTPHLMRDSQTDPTFALWRARAAQYGIRSCVTVPCHSGGRIAGVLAVYASEPDVFGPDELQLFERLSDEIGLSIKAEEDRVRLQAAEARLDVLVQDGPGVLFQDQLSGDGTWQRNYISPNVSGLTGYRPEQCVGTMPAILASAEAAELDVWHRAVLQARDTSSASCTLEARHADGRNIWVNCSLKARRLHSGGWLLTGYMIDVTRERQITEALEQARRFLEDATASGPGWLYQMTLFPGKPPRVDFVSDSVERFTGFTSAEAGSTEWLLERCEPGTSAMLEQSVERLLRLEHTAMEFRLRTKSGAWIWISDTVSPHPQPDGSVRAVGYMADITELKDRTPQLQQAARLAVLGEMATGMAHELRQPLSAISFAAQNAELTLDRGDAANTRLRLTRIIQQTERASNIIEHLRQFARGAEATAVAPVALDALLEGTLTLIGEALRLDGVAITQALGTPALAVLGQMMPLEQVLVNLLLNARDALVANRPACDRRIHIAAEPVPGQRMVRLIVSDNAGGIAPDLLPRLFEPFVTTKLAQKGTGLGLSICHGIAATLGGEIAAHNGPEGAVFTVTLPDASPQTAAAA